MEKDITRLDKMNSNFIGKQVGKPSELFVMASEFASDHPTLIDAIECQACFTEECLDGDFVGQSREQFMINIEEIRKASSYKQDNSMQKAA